MPSFGICSMRNTSLQRSDTARATAQPTTPPPMMTMFARSTTDRIDDLRAEARGTKQGTEEARRQGSGEVMTREFSIFLCVLCALGPAIVFGLKLARKGVEVCLA